MVFKSETCTLSDIFSEAGYKTVVVGKWHLWLGWAGGSNWNGYITPGPQDIGFDSSFQIPETDDREPCVYTENRRVLSLNPADNCKLSKKPESLGLTEKTVVIFNGENGQVVPFIVSWPCKMQNGTSDVLISQVGFMASFAKILNLQLKEIDAIDSYEMLDQLLGKSEINRDRFVPQGIRTLSLIMVDWKYIVPNSGTKISQFTNIEMRNDTLPQLFNLKNDIGETKNMATENTEKTKELQKLLSMIMQNGRTRN